DLQTGAREDKPLRRYRNAELFQHRRQIAAILLELERHLTRVDVALQPCNRIRRRRFRVRNRLVLGASRKLSERAHGGGGQSEKADDGQNADAHGGDFRISVRAKARCNLRYPSPTVRFDRGGHDFKRKGRRGRKGTVFLYALSSLCE